MTTLTETTHDAGFLLSEGEGQISRDNGILITGQDLAAGTVLGKITASGKWTAFHDDAQDGSGVAAGILLAACDASGGDAACVVIARMAEVIGDELVWPTQSPLDTAAAIVELASVHILVR